MKRRAAFLALPVAVAVVAGVTAAWSGHELPIYPSYYPQEIRIDTVAEGQAADLLLALTLTTTNEPSNSTART